jgi:hypothetical protein
MFPRRVLQPMRNFVGLPQTRLGRHLKHEYGLWRTQTDISRFELGGHDPRLQEALSEFYRSRGFDAEHSGAVLYIPQSTC